MTQRKRLWMRSFYTRAIAFRSLLTPFGTINRTYHLGTGEITYCDFFIFGIRIARIQL